MKKEQICTEVRYNYYPGSTDGQFPERYEARILQIDGVIKIRENWPQGDGDKYCIDVIYDTGHLERIFYPHWVHYINVQ